MHTPFYDPNKSYEHNFKHGPFGAFADGKRYYQRKKPKHRFITHPVHLPFGIAAGPLLNGAFVKAALDKGFDVVVYKTVRSRQHPCHPWPNVVPIRVQGNLEADQIDKEPLIAHHEFTHPLAITNSFGVPSFEPDFWQKDMAEAVAYAKNGQLVVGSFQGTPQSDGNPHSYITDFAHTAALVKETGVKVLEANLSCPNEGTKNLLCFDLERTRRVVEAIKNSIGDMPLILKLAFFVDNAQLHKLVSAVGGLVKGFAAINTIGARIVTPEGKQALPGEGRLSSGVCGKPIKWAGLDMVSRLKKLREDLNLNYAVTGVGGVIHPEDYHEYRYAGADSVMTATGAMWNPYLAQEIKESTKEIV
jgi:dihydroorotate dehydrogenase